MADNDISVQYIGLSDIELVEQDMVAKIVDEYTPKISRLVQNELSLVVHLKPHTKGGGRQRIEVAIRAVAPTKIFESHNESGEKEDWDLSTAVRKALDNIMKQMEKEFS